MCHSHFICSPTYQISWQQCNLCQNVEYFKRSRLLFLISSLSNRDALIRHWPIIGRPIISAWQSADYRPKLILLSCLCYSLRLWLLSEDSYLLEGLHPKAKLQNAPTFTGNGSHSHVCLLLVIKIKTCHYQYCVNDNRPIPTYQSADIDYRQNGRYWLSADYQCISTVKYSLHMCNEIMLC